ncbi:MAG: DUF4102 domain-containing protein [Xanthomonadaceae bacterium]|nr:DUF4102 domain-containing protein [Xanthomonadaceae bacterium]MDE2246442.1 DUF4102 domain-containing protein [Xanthomonadaceae bacterium]
MLYRVANALGLCIEVHPTGARYGRPRYRPDGREKMLGLGVHSDVSA